MAPDQVNALKVLDAELVKGSMKGLWAREERVASVFIARRAADSESKDERRRARL